MYYPRALFLDKRVCNLNTLGALFQRGSCSPVDQVISDPSKSLNASVQPKIQHIQELDDFDELIRGEVVLI